MQGGHGRQLFRWRKELCRIEAPSMQISNTLVSVVVSEAAAALPWPSIGITGNIPSSSEAQLCNARTSTEPLRPRR